MAAAKTARKTAVSTKKSTKRSAQKSAKKTAKKSTAKTAKTTARKRPGPKKMTQSHKNALARGRRMSATVDRYLEALAVPKQRGRKVSPATMRKRLAAAEARAETATGVAKVLAAQEVRDLRRRLDSPQTAAADMKSLEADFLKVARQFSEQRGISYGAWREAGVPASVLQKAGVSRTRN